MPSRTRGQSPIRTSSLNHFRPRWGLLWAGTVILGMGCGRSALLSKGDGASDRRRQDDSGAASDRREGLRLVAGHLGGPGSADGIGAAARFNLPTGIASDGAGHLFMLDNRTTIRRVVTATGEVTTLAGSPGQKGSTDGIGAAASFLEPAAIASDGAGNLFVADTYNSTIRKVVVATGAVTTLAGSARQRGDSDGTGASARFYYPSGIASDGTGRLFIADSYNHTLRAVVIATGEVTTLAGSPGQLGNADGTGVAARFSMPTGILADRAGKLFVVDSQNRTIRQVVIATGMVTTVARLLESAARGDKPLALASDGAGKLFVVIAGEGGSVIQSVVIATGEVTRFAGSPGQARYRDDVGSAARFADPSGIASDQAGNLFIADTNNHTIRKAVIATGAVTTFAGSVIHEGKDDGIGTVARFDTSRGVASDKAGNLFVADTNNHTIRKVVVASGEVTTLAGSPGESGSQDGAGTAARFSYPHGIASDGTGALFVADSNATIRKVEVASGEVTTLAGSPGERGHTDGTGATARFDHPHELASDGAGNLFVVDSENYTIRRVVVATGTVTTLAGSPRVQAGRRDGTGEAARFAQPSGLATDDAGNLFVADSGAIRQVVIATGEVTTLVGLPVSDVGVDGGGSEIRFGSLYGMASDGAGNLFVADGQTIRKVVVGTRAVTTVVGSPNLLGVVLGLLPARLASPRGLAFGPTGELFLSDIGENVILAVRF